MSSWNATAREEAFLMNSAMIASTVAQFCYSYTPSRPASARFMLTFVAVPLSLSFVLRHSLPQRASASIEGWATAHAYEASLLRRAVSEWSPAVRDGILFGCQHQLLVLDSDLALNSKRIQEPRWVSDERYDVAEIWRAASLVGRWFTREASHLNLLRTLGISL